MEKSFQNQILNMLIIADGNLLVNSWVLWPNSRFKKVESDAQ